MPFVLLNGQVDMDAAAHGDLLRVTMSSGERHYLAAANHVTRELTLGPDNLLAPSIRSYLDANVQTLIGGTAINDIEILTAWYRTVQRSPTQSIEEVLFQHLLKTCRIYRRDLRLDGRLAMVFSVHPIAALPRDPEYKSSWLSEHTIAAFEPTTLSEAREHEQIIAAKR